MSSLPACHYLIPILYNLINFFPFLVIIGCSTEYNTNPHFLQPTKSSLYDQKLRANSRCQNREGKNEKRDFESEFHTVEESEEDGSDEEEQYDGEEERQRGDEERHEEMKDMNENDIDIDLARTREIEMERKKEKEKKKEKISLADKHKLSSLSSDLTSCRGIGENYITIYR